MIPILKNGNNTSGFLKDAISCVVTEERNGIYELQMTYPLTGQHAKLITVGMNILAKPNDTSENQLFQIYEVTKPISGIFTVKAEHISYQLSHHPASSMDLGTTTANSAMFLLLNLSPTNTDFLDVWTDNALKRPFSFTVGSIRAGLGGSKGSVLDVFGGEFEFDNYTVKLHRNRGSDKGVIIAYRKNLTDLKLTTSIESSYTALYPYCLKDDVLTTLNPSTISVTNTSKIPTKILIKDFTSFFENDEEITRAALKEKAEAWLDENDINSPSINLSVSFQHLWQSPEYASLQALEKVSLCDTVTVWHSELDINIKTKVIKTVYDTLGEKYEKIELGSAKANFADTLIQSEQKLETEIEGIKNTNTNLHSQITQEYLAAIDEATKTITGNEGGYVVLYPSSFPQELLIMNQPYIDTATKMWRFNMGGLGYSSSGYDGPFKTAITMDGKINADFITTGTLTANIIRAGILTAADGSSFFDLESGEFSTGYANITGGYISIGGGDYRTEIIEGCIQQYSYFTDTDAPVGGMQPVGSANGHSLGLFCGYSDDILGVAILEPYNSNNAGFTHIASFYKTEITLNKATVIESTLLVKDNVTFYENLTVSEDVDVLGTFDCYSTSWFGGDMYIANSGRITVSGNIVTNDYYSDTYGSLYHYRTRDFEGYGQYTAYTTIGLGNPDKRPSFAVQLCNYGDTTAIARFDIMESYNNGLIAMRGYSGGTWSKMIELGDNMWFAGKFYSNGVLVSSTEEIKENIQESGDVLELFKNSKIYAYNYIDAREDVEDDSLTVSEPVVAQTFNMRRTATEGSTDDNKPQPIPYTGPAHKKNATAETKESYGFVIERETPNAVISADGKHIDMYSMSAIVWKGMQELLQKIETLEDEISVLKGE